MVTSNKNQGFITTVALLVLMTGMALIAGTKVKVSVHSMPST